MLSSPSAGPRAGFWRRASALILDLLLAGLVISVVGPLAFSLTGGKVQTGGVGISTSSCGSVSTVPAGLEPPFPEGSNYAEVCRAGALPFATSERFLRVGRRTVSAGRVEYVSRSYALSAAGAPIAAINLTWLGQLGLLAYFLVCLARRGRTLGMRLLRLRLLIPPAETSPIGVPIRLLLVRTGVALGGFLPAALAALLAHAVTTSGAASPFFTPVALLSMSWMGYNAVLIVRGEDPVYDHVAGLAVLVEAG